MSLIVALLAPMFLCVSGGDINLARLAAFDTVTAYRAKNQADLLSIAQIIGFGLAALGSLSLSMADNISLSMTLRLRGNANALNRSAEQNRRALKENRHETTLPQPAGRDLEADPRQAAVIDSRTSKSHAATAIQAHIEAPQQSTSTSTPMPASTTDEQRHQAMWANAMTNVAAELTTSLPNLPPAERWAAEIRAAALTNTANELLSGNSEPRLRPGALDGLIRPNPA